MADSGESSPFPKVVGATPHLSAYEATKPIKLTAPHLMATLPSETAARRLWSVRLSEQTSLHAAVATDAAMDTHLVGRVLGTRPRPGTRPSSCPTFFLFQNRKPSI